MKVDIVRARRNAQRLVRDIDRDQIRGPAIDQGPPVFVSRDAADEKRVATAAHAKCRRIRRLGCGENFRICFYVGAGFSPRCAG